MWVQLLNHHAMCTEWYKEGKSKKTKVCTAFSTKMERSAKEWWLGSRMLHVRFSFTGALVYFVKMNIQFDTSLSNSSH